MRTKPNDATFPLKDDDYYLKQTGLTKLEYFAAAALQGLAANPNINWVSEDKIAKASLVCAKILINELNEQKEQV